MAVHATMASNWRMCGRRRGLSVVAIVVGLISSAPTSAQDYKTRDVSGWTVSPSRDGDGCFLTRQYDGMGNTTLLLGIDADGSNHLSVLNDNWSIKPRERLKLNFRLSGGAYTKHDVVGMASGGKRGFVTSFEKKFPIYFAASLALDISRGTVPVEHLDLAGSGAAVAEVRRCVDAQRANGGPRKEKGARSGDIPRDPFASGPKPRRKR